MQRRTLLFASMGAMF
ncbi:hypothetical protein AX774_g6588, partial [Zancudomyces culisetae]